MKNEEFKCFLNGIFMNIKRNKKIGDKIMTEKKTFSPKAWANINIAEQIRIVVERIVEMGVDITADYNRWRNTAFALSKELGDGGRNYFHEISKFYAGYDQQECDKLYDDCIKRLQSNGNHSGITIRSFFGYAKEAGVDVHIANADCGITPAYHAPQAKNNHLMTPTNPTMGMSEAANSANLANLANLAKAANSAKAAPPTNDTPEHEIPEDTPLPTFSDKVKGKLPPIFEDIAALGKTTTEQDMLLLASITILSGAFPEVYAIYDDMRVYANLFTFLVANAASGKGRTAACLKLVSRIEQEIRNANKQEMKDYQQELAEIRAMGSKKSAFMPMPKEPPYRSMLIPANCSSTAIYQALHDNHDQGITFETEADSLANTLKSDYGNFSDGLRKGFHHESITYRRRKENEHVEIHNPKWTVYLTGTPGQVSNLIPSPENGLFSRFLFMKIDIPVKWHNVFSTAKRTIDEEMEAIGERIFSIHQQLSSPRFAVPKAIDNTGTSRISGIKFELTEAQRDRFNSFFDNLVEEYKNMLGRDFVASLYRLGLSTFRIAMVLSIARLEGNLLGSSIICQDEDLKSAILIAETLMQHAARIFATLMPEKEGENMLGVKLNPKSERLFTNLPDKFNRQTVLAIAKKQNIAQRTAEKYVGEYVNKYTLCKRTGNGEYEKIKTASQQDTSQAATTQPSAS